MFHNVLEFLLVLFVLTKPPDQMLPLDIALNQLIIFSLTNIMMLNNVLWQPLKNQLILLIELVIKFGNKVNV